MTERRQGQLRKLTVPIAVGMALGLSSAAFADTGTTKIRINLREAPDLNTAVVKTLPQGSELQILGYEGEFAMLQTADGDVGYLKTKYLEVVETAPEPAVAPDPVEVAQVEAPPAPATPAAPAAPAAAPANPDDAVALSRIAVTGSRIQKDEFVSSSQVASFDRDYIDAAGIVTLDEFLMQIPAFTGFQLSSTTNNGAEQGQKKVDLRGLGFNRTLVLINGRRQVGDANGDGAVDLNTVPMAMVERVEVLKDGASTIYGSDAIAGVVNVILRDDFEGVEFQTNYGAGTEDGQAENFGFSLLAGTGNSKGRMVGALSYTRQSEMLQAERPWAQFDLYPGVDPATGRLVPVEAGSSNSRRIRVDLDGDGTLESNRIVDAETGQARPFGSGDTYNFAPVNALVTPSEIWQISALGERFYDNGMRAFFEGLYTRRTSQQRLAPDASFAVTATQDTPNNGPQWNDFVPANNPFNPYGVNPRNPDGISGEDVRINRRFVESGGRLFVQGADTFRMVGGLGGELDQNNISWELSYLFAQNETINDTKNYGRFDRWATAVDPEACAADAACTAAGGVLNPFDDYGSISPGQMAYLSTNSLKDRYLSQMAQILGVVSGDGFALPGGMLQWAAGYESRREKGEFSPDEFIGSGLTTGGAGDPQSGAFSVDEFYGEVYAPILHNLSVDLSARYSDYDTSAGSQATFSIGVDYQPLDMVAFRAGFGTGFRAPNISELNQGDQGTFPIIETICEFADRRLAAGDISAVAYENCQAMGAGTDDAGALGFAWQSLQTESAPAAPLDPEESESFHVGVIFTPTMIDGLTLGLDYWSTKVENLIGSPDANDILLACINSVGFSSPACGAFDTDGDGVADGVGVGQPYFQGTSFPADLVTAFGNLGTLETSGVDFNLDYLRNVDLGPITRVGVLGSATYLIEYLRTFALSGTSDLAGTANGFATFPELRANLDLNLYGNSWSASWQMRYIGESEDALRPGSATDDAVAEAILYHDLVGSYSFGRVRLSGGINNVLDEEPPFFHSAFNAETEPGMFDVIGRRLFLSVQADI